MEELKIGDVVILKSGGPLMTVSGIKEGIKNKVQCVWFNKEESIYEEFDKALLKLPKNDDALEVTTN